MRGIFLSVALLFSIALLTSNVYGQEASISSISLEETSILELSNDSTGQVNTLRIWVGSDFNIESFKTEKGWTGEKNPLGVVVFTASESIKPGESVKFGVKTDKSNAQINWKALDSKDALVGTGTAIAKELSSTGKNQQPDPTPDPKPDPTPDPKPIDPPNAMTNESVFRIVPEKPNVGSSIRVTGSNFGPLQALEFYIDSKKIDTFETDENGHFMETVEIPDDQKADRADLKIRTSDGEEKKMSIRIGENVNRIPPSDNIPLTVKGIPDMVYRGSYLEVSGTGNPNGAITVDITTPDGEVINTRPAEINNKGDWKVDEPILVAPDTPFGKYSAVISDGRESIQVGWTVETDKKIIISSTTIKFEPGETMRFNGTALPNKTIEISLKDPLGNEVASDIKKTDDLGNVAFEFPITHNMPEGTYTLTATQGDLKEVIYVGLGQLPVIPVGVELDKLNYRAGETAIVSLSGEPTEIVSLLILNPSDKPVANATSITLQLNGRASHSIDLTGYGSGVYHVIVNKGSAQSREIFTVGLGTGSREIDINTTKTEYRPGDQVLILGKAGPNVLITITMTDPDGNVIKVKETFSDKNEKISEDAFRIPSEATPGIWTINAKSGATFDNAKIEVLGSSISDGMIVSAIYKPKLDKVSDFITIHVVGAANTVQIEIVTADGRVIEELAFQASKEGVIELPWKIAKDVSPGTYTIKVADSLNSAETTFEIT